MSPYVETWPPHIHTQDSVPKLFWGYTGALLPVLIAGAIFFKGDFLRVLTLSLLSSWGFEWAAKNIFKKKTVFYNGEAVLIALLFTLTVPPSLSSGLVILGSFIAVFLIKESFGGLGSTLFHPVLTARVFLQIGFPQALNAPLIFQERGALLMLFSLCAGVLLLLWQKRSPVKTPLLFLAVVFLGTLPLESLKGFFPMLNLFLFSAFFLVFYPAATPMTRLGKSIFSLGAGGLSAALGLQGQTLMHAVSLSVLAMGLWTPWLDLLVKAPGISVWILGESKGKT